MEQDAPRHYQDQVLRFMDPFAVALVESCVTQGDAVLDVACGTGVATRMAKTAVGATGRVVGADINGAMVAFASEISSDDTIEWRQASALDLPYDPETFDRVICQQGTQFFPRPAVGLAEMARVTRAGGTLALTVWSDLEDSPYLAAMYHMLATYCDADEDDMAWSCTQDQVADWFIDAGLGRPAIESLVRSVTLPLIEDFVPAHMKSTPWADRFDDLSPAESTKAVRSIQRRLVDWTTPPGVDVPFVSYLATAVI